MNLHDEVEKIKGEGYSEANAEAKLCQDIVLKAIAAKFFYRRVYNQLKSLQVMGLAGMVEPFTDEYLKIIVR